MKWLKHDLFEKLYTMCFDSCGNKTKECTANGITNPFKDLSQTLFNRNANKTFHLIEDRKKTTL